MKFYTESIPNVILSIVSRAATLILFEVSLIDKYTLTSKLIIHHISKGCKPYLFRLNLNTYSSGSTLFHPFDFLACATLLGNMWRQEIQLYMVFSFYNCGSSRSQKHSLICKDELLYIGNQLWSLKVVNIHVDFFDCCVTCWTKMCVPIVVLYA